MVTLLSNVTSAGTSFTSSGSYPRALKPSMRRAISFA